MPRFFAALASVACLMLVVPAGGDDGLALEIVDLVDVARLLGDVAAGGEEVGVGEPHLLLALGVVGGGAALQIDGAVGHQRNAGGRRDRVELHLELGELQLLLHGVDDLGADVHGEADGLLLVVEVGEGNRRFPEADGDGARLLDLLQRAAVLGIDRLGASQGPRGQERGPERSGTSSILLHSWVARRDKTAFAVLQRIPASTQLVREVCTTIRRDERPTVRPRIIVALAPWRKMKNGHGWSRPGLQETVGLRRWPLAGRNKEAPRCTFCEQSPCSPAEAAAPLLRFRYWPARDQS